MSTNNQDPVRPSHSDEPVCPICLEAMTLELETNCGHLFCGICILELERRSGRRKQLICPLCRQPIHLFLKRFRDRTLPESERVLEMVTAYNKYASENHSFSVWETIRSMPVLLHHLGQRIIENGLEFDQVNVTVLILLGVSLFYFFLPVDIIPEVAFGLFGLIDDIVLFFYCLFYLSVFYRHHLVNNDNA